MQTHDDLQHRDDPYMRRLKERADEAMRNSASQITAGYPNEKAIDEYLANDVYVTQRPDDEQGILRISVGGGVRNRNVNYCVFRGDRKRVIDLLKKAVVALEARTDTDGGNQ